MEVSKPSVSRAVAVLQQGGFLTVDSDYFLHLTEACRMEHAISDTSFQKLKEMILKAD